jgi:hypothetical protein
MRERSSNESDTEFRENGGSRWGRILLPITLVVAIAAAALSGWLLIRLAQEGTLNSPNYSGAQRADAKTKICAAADALYSGGQYLLARVDPATPPELADAVKKFGNLLMDIGAGATAGQQNSEPEQTARLNDADAANKTITELCK